ncbi:hypothetical protein R9C00_17465 [Flammeovirgaceae bacterium SG7u.111]|nr:hypothetical protein [Flammeovirgaceae bacterium SG7u.132]WPO33492.1 hypothetical protein R9C00_17465 [Flammeovirgaceae bacterium SG7u.111]
MKKILVLMMCIFAAQILFACGTVKSRADFYLHADSYDRKLLELTYLNCESVMKSYSNEPEQDDLLVEVLLDAFLMEEQLKKDPELAEQFKVVALATFFRFEGLKNQVGSPKYNLLEDKIANRLSLSPHKWRKKWEGQKYIIFNKFSFPFSPSDFYSNAVLEMQDLFFDE